MIRSKTDKSMDAALKQLEGKLSLKLQHMRGELIDIMSHIEASIDFPEDDIEDVLYLDLERDCGSIIGELDEIIQGADAGKIMREGLNTVIVGKPNVGKSSLLNALLEENRAIVTDVPGTTRDIIEEYLNIGGIPINIIDTAGIRETSDEVERIGVEKTREYFDRADLVIFILDSGGQLSREDENIFSLIGEKKTIILINKVDLPQRLDRSRVEELGRGSVIIDVSVREGMGIDRLKEEIQNLVYNGEASFSSEILVTNVRHKDLLVRASECLKNAVDTIRGQLPLDFVSIDIRGALEYVGQITGETVQEDIINRIFSQFCVGK
jgi:tRNA modification GTPase